MGASNFWRFFNPPKMGDKTMKNTIRQISPLFSQAALLISLMIPLGHLKAMETPLTSNPNDVIISMTQEIKLTTERHTQEINNFTGRVSNVESRISTLEKFVNNISQESPAIVKKIPIDLIIKVSFAAAIVQGCLYLYGPILLTPFLVIYFWYTNYAILKLIRDTGAVVSIPSTSSASTTKKTQ